MKETILQVSKEGMTSQKQRALHISSPVFLVIRRWGKVVSGVNYTPFCRGAWTEMLKFWHLQLPSWEEDLCRYVSSGLVNDAIQDSPWALNSLTGTRINEERTRRHRSP